MLFRGQGFHRQRVNFFAHAVTQRRIHQLVTLNQALADKCGRDNQRTEVLAIAFDFEMRALKAGSNIVFDEFRCGQHDFAFVQK